MIATGELEEGQFMANLSELVGFNSGQGRLKIIAVCLLMESSLGEIQTVVFGGAAQSIIVRPS